MRALAAAVDSQQVVALFNSDLERMALLRGVLGVSGFTVVSALIPEINEDGGEAAAFLRTHDPRVVVYDVGPPFAQNWRLMERIRATREMRDRALLITSSDPHYVAHLAGRDETIYGVTGRPYDLGRLAQIVKEASRSRPTREDGFTRPSLPLPTVVQLERRQHADRRDQGDRRESSPSNDLYRRLRTKRAEIESDRRHGHRRVDGAR